MALCIGKTKQIKITDRTIPEIFSRNRNIDHGKLICFSRMLKDIGVDLIEINTLALDKYGTLPEGTEFIYRVESTRDSDVCIKYNIKNCVVRKQELLDFRLLQKLAENGVNITAEFRINNLKELCCLQAVKKLDGAHLINNIRVTGLSSFITDEWTNPLRSISEALNVGIDVCPENSLFNAASAAFETVMHGFDGITATFAGLGTDNGYAALEEVLVASRVLLNFNSGLNLELIPEIAVLFTEMTGIDIAGSKPVLGKDIFKYESGIHADGIEKNPSTYELYDPALIGGKRTLCIGKHSGTGAVVKKLKELNMSCRREDASAALDAIRKRSIKWKRNLDNSEIMEIFEACL